MIAPDPGIGPQSPHRSGRTGIKPARQNGHARGAAKLPRGRPASSPANIIAVERGVVESERRPISSTRPPAEAAWQTVEFALQMRTPEVLRCLSESYVLRKKGDKAQAGTIPARAGDPVRATHAVRRRRRFPARAFDRAHRAIRPSLSRQTPLRAPILRPQAGCAARRPIA